MRVARLSVALSFIFLAGSVALFAGQGPQVSKTRLTFVRTSKPSKSAALQNIPEDFQYKIGPEVDVNFTKPLISGTVSPARVPAAHVPTAPGNPISSGSFSGLAGITHRE
jgi:hypothetical protein